MILFVIPMMFYQCIIWDADTIPTHRVSGFRFEQCVTITAHNTGPVIEIENIEWQVPHFQYAIRVNQNDRPIWQSR